MGLSVWGNLTVEMMISHEILFRLPHFQTNLSLAKNFGATEHDQIWPTFTALIHQIPSDSIRFRPSRLWLPSEGWASSNLYLSGMSTYSPAIWSRFWVDMSWCYSGSMPCGTRSQNRSVLENSELFLLCSGRTKPRKWPCFRNFCMEKLLLATCWKLRKYQCFFLGTV